MLGEAPRRLSVSFMLRVLCVFEPMNPGNKEPVAVRAIPIQLYRGGDDVKVALGACVVVSAGA